MVNDPVRADLHGADADVLQILAIQSGDPDRIRQVLDLRNPLASSLVPLVIPLLGDKAVAADAMLALRPIAETRAGALVDALLDAGLPRIVRHRLARLLSLSRSEIVIDGLLQALSDDVLDIRVQSARALFTIRRAHPEVYIDPDLILDRVRVELALGTPDLAHLFTLLAFVLPVQPLRVAFRSLRGSSERARGTALEYLGAVVPADVRKDLLKILES